MMSDIRLIDANALRKAFAKHPMFNSYWLNQARAIIDLAPTVEPEITDEDIQNAIKQGYNDGYAMAKAKFERPQGEWEHISDDTNKQRVIYKCSVCGRIIDVYYREDLAFSYPFCHCGADMRGGGGDD